MYCWSHSCLNSGRNKEIVDPLFFLLSCVLDTRRIEINKAGHHLYSVLFSSFYSSSKMLVDKTSGHMEVGFDHNPLAENPSIRDFGILMDSRCFSEVYS